MTPKDVLLSIMLASLAAPAAAEPKRKTPGGGQIFTDGFESGDLASLKAASRGH